MGLRARRALCGDRVDRSRLDHPDEDPPGCVVDALLRDLPAGQCGSDRLTLVAGQASERELIDARVEPRDHVPDRKGRVGLDESREPVLEDAEQFLVLAGIFAADLIVGAHDRGGPAGADGRLEGRQVDLAQGPRGCLDIDGGCQQRRAEAAVFLVVQRVVLDVGHDPPALDAPDLGSDEARAQERVLAERLGRPAPARIANDVHGRREEQIVPGRGCLRTEGGSVRPRQARVPRSADVDGVREGGHSLCPFADPVRPVGGVDRGDAQPRRAGAGVDQVELLVVRHLTEQRVGPLPGAFRTGGRGRDAQGHESCQQPDRAGSRGARGEHQPSRLTRW